MHLSYLVKPCERAESMELSDLLVFRTVAEQGGVSKAAHKLNRVPSNVTARVQKLEQELGTQLFIREKNRLKTSSAGRQLLGYADRILSLAEEAKNELNASEPSGQLKVGSMEAAATTHLAPLLKDFHHSYPGVDLTLKTAPTGDLINYVIQGELDLAFVADPPEDSRLKRLLAFKENLVLVSSLDYPKISSPDQLNAKKTLLGFNPTCTYRRRLEAWIQSSDKAFNLVEISSYATLLNCAAAGMGVGLVPESLIRLYPFPDTLKVHRLAKQWSQSNTFLIWRNGFETAAINAFTQGIKHN